MANGPFPQKCPRQVVGDIQLESILTPLLFPRIRPTVPVTHTPHDTQPDLRLLDVGCGWGRLLGGLLLFPPHITTHLHYVGCEPSQDELHANYQRLGALQQELLGTESFVNYFAEVSFLTWDTVLERGQDQFDYVFLVNVLHHLPVEEVTSIFSNISRVVKADGYLLIHDFFLGEPQVRRDYSKYCDKSVFFGPQHLSAIFSMASTQTGLYRVMRRQGTSNTYYDLFTFILQFSNELSEKNSHGDDDLFSYPVYIPTALEVCLTHMRQEIEFPRKERLPRYRYTLAEAQNSLRASRYNSVLNHNIAKEVAERWLRSGAPRVRPAF